MKERERRIKNGGEATETGRKIDRGKTEEERETVRQNKAEMKCSDPTCLSREADTVKHLKAGVFWILV